MSRNESLGRSTYDVRGDNRVRSDLVSILREEIIAVIAKHVAIDRDKVTVKMAKGETLSTLEVNLEIKAPTNTRIALAS